MQFMFHIIFILALVFAPITMVVTKYHKLQQTKILLKKMAPVVKSDYQKRVTKEIRLREIYPQFSRLPLKHSMEWAKVLRGIDKKDKLLKRKIKEIGLGDFDARLQRT